MKRMLALILVAVVLTGCESTKYAYNQTFGDQSEYGAFQTKLEKPEHNDSMLASADDWIKRHLW